MGRRGRKRKQLVDDLKETRCYKLKEEALDHTLGENWLCKWAVVRQTTWLWLPCAFLCIFLYLIRISLHFSVRLSTLTYVFRCIFLHFPMYFPVPSYGIFLRTSLWFFCISLYIFQYFCLYSLHPSIYSFYCPFILSYTLLCFRSCLAYFPL